jgi:hypothetical protein
MLVNAGVPRTAKPRRRLPHGVYNPIVALAVFLTVVGPAASEVLLAQRPDPPSINVAPAILAKPESKVRLPIQIGSVEALPKSTLVFVRGLPWSVSLTEGRGLGAGLWAVSLPELPWLNANVPTGVSGRYDIVITLVNAYGTLLAEARTTLVIGTVPIPAQLEPVPIVPRQSLGSITQPAPATAGGARTETPTARPSQISPEDKARAEQLVAQGDKYLADANIEVARQFFRRAADAGLAAAAIRLAASYDPAELARLHVLGVVPDRSEARKWYERARELGAPEAKERLARLGAN